jgi:hypothetical protein
MDVLELLTYDEAETRLRGGEKRAVRDQRYWYRRCLHVLLRTDRGGRTKMAAVLLVDAGAASVEMLPVREQDRVGVDRLLEAVAKTQGGGFVLEAATHSSQNAPGYTVDEDELWTYVSSCPPTRLPVYTRHEEARKAIAYLVPSDSRFPSKEPDFELAVTASLTQRDIRARCECAHNKGYGTRTRMSVWRLKGGGVTARFQPAVAAWFCNECHACDTCLSVRWEPPRATWRAQGAARDSDVAWLLQPKVARLCKMHTCGAAIGSRDVPWYGHCKTIARLEALDGLRATPKEIAMNPHTIESYKNEHVALLGLREAAETVRRHAAAALVQRCWRRATSMPTYEMCRARLRRELEETL